MTSITMRVEIENKGRMESRYGQLDGWLCLERLDEYGINERDPFSDDCENVEGSRGEKKRIEERN